MIAQNPPQGVLRPFATDESAFRHVAKHLYDPRERWDQVCRGLPQPPYRNAVVVGSEQVGRPHPEGYGASSEACRKAVLSDHEKFMQPAYEEAWTSAQEASRWGRWNDSRGATAYVGDNGVLVIVSAAFLSGLQTVKTAYRVTPLGIDPRRASSGDFFNAALRRLRDKTTYGEGDSAHER